MRAQGLCGDYPGRNTRSRSSRLKSCHVGGNLDNVVIIDDDNENVIAVDVPESLQQKLSGSTVLREGGKFPFQGRVCIDVDDDDDVDDLDDDDDDVDDLDDDDDDEGDPLANSVEGDPDLDNDSTGSESGPASDHAERFGDDDDDCQVVNKTPHPFKLSKCKRTCAEKTTGRNHYGLYFECESDSSHSDSDCEVIDGSSGDWEKAFLERRSAHKNRHRQEDQAVPCSSHETGTNAEAEKKTDKNAEPCTKFKSNNYGVFTDTLDGAASGGSCKVGPETFYRTFNGKVDGARSSRWYKPRTPRYMNSSGKADYRGEASSSGPKIDSDDIEGTGSGVHDKNKEFHGKKFSFHAFDQSEETVIENVVGSSEHEGKTVHKESFIRAHEKPGPRKKDKTDDRDPSSSVVIDPITVNQGNIINDREKLKETDEYRRAMEEEWAARQQQLKIQAEEARRQRKRKKAELRVLEMEKRQKQRLEEVRESQKKVEENLNMKERLRSEVRNEICKLEVMCKDMASLLRGLGIQVEGGSSPSSDEVHAAYKRALLKFHPDRTSRTDIQKQVEAEEKFKLISRMKERFLSTSC